MATVGAATASMATVEADITAEWAALPMTAIQAEAINPAAENQTIRTELGIPTPARRAPVRIIVHRAPQPRTGQLERIPVRFMAPRTPRRRAEAMVQRTAEGPHHMLVATTSNRSMQEQPAEPTSSAGCISGENAVERCGQPSGRSNREHLTIHKFATGSEITEHKDTDLTCRLWES